VLHSPISKSKSRLPSRAVSDAAPGCVCGAVIASVVMPTTTNAAVMSDVIDVRISMIMVTLGEYGRAGSGMAQGRTFE
jgi:hypothetical protein